MKFIIAIITLAVTTGCLSYKHTGANGEETHIISFLNVGEAKDIELETIQEDYGRTIKVGAIAGKGDVDMLKAIFEAGMRAGAKSAMPTP